MTISIQELIQRLPQNTEARVKGAKTKYLGAIQELMRKESGLLLNRKALVNRPESSVSIPISVIPGIPTQLRDISFDEEYRMLLPLLPYHSLLGQLADSAPSVHKIVQGLHSSPESSLYQKRSADFDYLGRYSEQLLFLLNRVNPVKRILEINSDVLGTYQFSLSVKGKAKIELYWGVIGLVADMLSVSPESLTCVVLAHELAHGYSHNATDIDGERWDTYAFKNADLSLVEGVAQYYTHLICAKLDDRVPGAFGAYAELLLNQS